MEKSNDYKVIKKSEQDSETSKLIKAMVDFLGNDLDRSSDFIAFGRSRIINGKTNYDARYYEKKDESYQENLIYDALNFKVPNYSDLGISKEELNDILNYKPGDLN